MTVFQLTIVQIITLISMLIILRAWAVTDIKAAKATAKCKELSKNQKATLNTWEVTKQVISVPPEEIKGKIKEEIVHYGYQKTDLANDLEWPRRINVTISNTSQVQLIGSAPAEPDTDNEKELQKLVAIAEERVAFYNINGVI